MRTSPSSRRALLHAATARAIGVAARGDGEWGKVHVIAGSAVTDLPLAAIYVLAPVNAMDAVVREARDTRAAALALVANGKITELLGRDVEGDVLSRCVAMAHVTRMYDLAVPRDLARLDEVARALLAWHGGPAANIDDAVTAVDSER